MTDRGLPIRCPKCGGRGDDDDCVCLGTGVTWGDGQPMTFCPSVAEPTRGRDRCGRGGEACRGCGRPSDQIPTADDVARSKLIYAKLDKRIGTT